MSFVAKKVGRKMFAGQAAAMEPTDPHYETYQDDRGKTHSRKRAMPEGLSKKDKRILRSVRRRAHYLDKGFSLCGFRFGWTAIFGLIPSVALYDVVQSHLDPFSKASVERKEKLTSDLLSLDPISFLGDIIGFLLSYSLVLKKCRQADLPASVQSRMVFNQMVGSGVGMIPLVGDIILAVWKANSRNALLLEDYLIAKSKTGASPESAGQEALSIAAMSGKTGERPGERDVSGDYGPDSPETSTPAYAATAVKGTSSSGAAVSASTRRADAQPKKYGWGSSGSKNLNEDQRPLTQASVKNGKASRRA